MLLNAYVEPAYTVARNDGQPVTVPPKERTYLWSDGYMLTLPSGFFTSHGFGRATPHPGSTVPE